MREVTCGNCGTTYSIAVFAPKHECVPILRAEVERLRAERDDAWKLVDETQTTMLQVVGHRQRAEERLAKVAEALHADPPLVMPKDEYDRISSLPGPPIGMAWGAGYRAAQRAALEAAEEEP